ncbi:hypothetical protein [Deinococcus sp. KSM4-11]|uniref:hypothetical protein n=1 Tax=Deinococcus sp. KSM4-11 TaxID=2568654 RepID=UPI001454D620|nr:hypothetical protein [Deinococcus sp. KSM4-11]
MSAPETRPTGRDENPELAGLPHWLYPAGFWVAVALLAVGVLLPGLAAVGVIWVAAVPVLAAVWVALAGWRLDRRLSVAALFALGGLVLVFIVKQFI